MNNAPSTKCSLALACLLAFCPLSASSAATDLVSLGTDSFTVDTGFSDMLFSQTSTTLSLLVPFSFGQILAGDLITGAPFDWSSAPALALSSSSAVAPSATLFVEFQNASFAPLATFSVGTGLATSTPTSFELTAAPGSSISSLINVSALQFTWGANSSAGDSALVVHSIQSVPEPSTYALLAISGVALGGYLMRRRSRA